MKTTAKRSGPVLGWCRGTCTDTSGGGHALVSSSYRPTPNAARRRIRSNGRVAIPMGNVLGAFLAAMLYDTVGPALLATLNPDQLIPSMSTIRLECPGPDAAGRGNSRQAGCRVPGRDGRREAARMPTV